jgi:cobalamin-dependent methionine synthase I
MARKGDVHDIGKKYSFSGVGLNNTKIVDLGVMGASEKLLRFQIWYGILLD